VERRICFSTSSYSHCSELKRHITNRDVTKGGSIVDEMLKLIGNFGFPIVVSAYLLVRIEGKLGELTKSITELAKAIAVIKA